jgi:hypothetical protein
LANPDAAAPAGEYFVSRESFAVGFAAYEVFGVWLWKAARRHDESVSQGGKIGGSNDT